MVGPDGWKSEVEAERATSQQLRGYLQETEDAAADTQHKLEDAQAAAAKNKRLEIDKRIGWVGGN